MEAKSMKLTPKQLHILQHSLGVDQYGQGDQYRNRFVTGPLSDDWAVIQSLVVLGAMEERHVASELTGGDSCFLVTAAGRAAMAEQSPKPPKLTRSQRRYQDYRNYKDAWGCSFLEYLRSGYWRRAQ